MILTDLKTLPHKPLYHQKYEYLKKIKKTKNYYKK